MGSLIIQSTSIGLLHYLYFYSFQPLLLVQTYFSASGYQTVKIYPLLLIKINLQDFTFSNFHLEKS